MSPDRPGGPTIEEHSVIEQSRQSRRDDADSRRFGTFSYLPPLTDVQILAQVEYMLARGWSCAVEHVEPAHAPDRYWYMWKLPLFGASDAATVLAEVSACRDRHPADHVRVVAYDARRQTQGQSIVVHRGAASVERGGLLGG